MTIEDNTELSSAEKLRQEIDDELGTSTAAAAGDGKTPDPDAAAGDAGKDDAGGEGKAAGDSGAPDPEAGAEGAAAAEAAGAGEGAGEGDGAKPIDPEILRAIADGDGPLIPKGRFDEATGRLKDQIHDLTGKVGLLEAQRSAALAPLGEPRDFAAERAALKERYNDEDSDMDQDAYLDARDKLTLEEAEYRARETALVTQQKASEDAALAVWKGKVKDFETRNSEAMQLGSIRASVAAFLESNDDPTLSDDELLAKAEQHLADEVEKEKQRMLKFLGITPPPAQKVDPHAERNAADASAVAAAAGAPKVAGGGMGERGKNDELGNKLLTAEEWKNLPEAEKKRRLGED